MFIQIEVIFNLNMMKFLLGCEIVLNGFWEFESEEDVVVLLFVFDLFLIEGVMGVFLGVDFIVIIKSEVVEWDYIKFFFFGVIMDGLQFGCLIFGDVEDESGYVVYDGESFEVVKEIIELIDMCVCLVVVQDGGDILFYFYLVDSGIVCLKMWGVCFGCLFLMMILKFGIQNLLQYYILEIQFVEVVEQVGDVCVEFF